MTPTANKMPFFHRILTPLALVLLVSAGTTACKRRSGDLATVNGRAVKQAEFDAYLKLKHVSPAEEKRRERALDEFLDRAALGAVIEREPGLDKAAIEAEVAEVRRELLISRYFDRFLEQKVTDTAVKNYYQRLSAP